MALDDKSDYGNPPGAGPLRPGGKSVAALPQTEQDLPSTPSAAVKAQTPALQLVRDVAGGTEVVRSKTTLYLPKAPGESPENYNVRLQRSVFFNVFGKTVEGLAGFVFAKDPVLGEDVPVEIRGEPETDESAKREGIWENIDLAGTHGDVFLADIFEDALTAGHAVIFVEYPQTGGTQNSREEMTGEVRPYWIPIKKDQIRSWRTAVVGGKTIVTQFVFEECTMVPNGAFGEQEQKRYRVLYNDNGVVGFRLLEITDKNVVNEVDRGLYPTQTEIPIAEVVTSGRKSMFESQPPLLDLAYLNIAHYQQWSDYAISIHKTCVPLLTLAGFTQPTDTNGVPQSVVVGPNSVLFSIDPNAKAQYTSHDGAALGSCKASLDDLKSDMSIMGLSMLAPQKRAAETAEAKKIDKGATDSQLGKSARGLQDGAERALGFTAKYMKKPSGGSLTVNRDFEANQMDAATMTAIGNFAETIGMPVKAVVLEIQKGGRFVDQDADELSEEIETIRQAKKDFAEAQLNAKRDAIAAGDETVPAEKVA